MQFDDYSDRFERLERAIDRGRAAVGTTASEPEAAMLAQLIAAGQRLRMLTDEMARRATEREWDSVDVLTARLLLNDLAEALAACRAITNAAAERLRVAGGVVKEGNRLLECRADRAGRRASDV